MHVEGRGAYLLLRTLKFTMAALGMYADNEKVVRPRLRFITIRCLSLAASSMSAGPNYYYVLRGLFRVITTGKLEYCFQELLPILPAIYSAIPVS